MTDILEFSGENRWLSNFTPCTVKLDDVSYPSTENAYQAAKTLDPLERVAFQSISAGEAKKLGRVVTMRPDWGEVKRQVMFDLSMQKFAQEPFKTQLLETGDAHIEEGNYWGDVYWGTCNGEGKNHLGLIIMRVRNLLNTGFEF